LLFSLWSGRYTNGIGIVSNPPLAAMAASVGLSRAAFETGLTNLHDAKCIVWDREADEICITPGGHFKFLHLWPGQIPPVGNDRTGGFYSLAESFASRLAASLSR
jgi:hypothetical protein